MSRGGDCFGVLRTPRNDDGYLLAASATPVSTSA
jgi:hypothetical protein